MIKLIKKHKYIYLFLITLTIIGLINGYIYFELQSKITKTEILESINIEENLNYRVNNLSKSLNISLKIIINSILILPTIINIINIFYHPFEIGFLYNSLTHYNKKLSLIYLTIYKIIPCIFYLILTRIALSLTISIIKRIINKNKYHNNNIKLSIKKYLIFLILLIIYEIIIIIISPIINGYLMTIMQI